MSESMVASPALVGRSETVMSSALAFVAGYVDTIGFVALFGLFTAHVTGNFVLIGSVLAGSSGSVLLKLLAFPAFIAAVAAARLFERSLRRSGLSPLPPLLLVQAALLAVSMAVGMYAAPIRSPDAPLAIVCGVTMAVAMGVQNAAARLVLTDLPPTTVMTGNVTQVVIDAIDLWFEDLAASKAGRMVRFLWAIAGFAFGALAGGIACLHLGVGAISLAVAILLWLAATAGWRSGSPDASTSK